MARSSSRAILALRAADIAGTIWQSWITKVVISAALGFWAGIEGLLAGIPPMFIIVAVVLTTAATAHLLILVDLWRRSTGIQHRLKSSGYPFAYNSGKVGEKILITDGYAQIPLTNASDSPIHFRFTAIRVVIDGKTNEDMYGAAERECYELLPHTSIAFMTRTIQFGVEAPGYMGGVVDFELQYGKSPSNLRYRLKRKYKLHLYIADTGAINASGVEMDVSTPMEEVG